jgi:intracellular multiplication protein IcmL
VGYSKEETIPLLEAGYINMADAGSGPSGEALKTDGGVSPAGGGAVKGTKGSKLGAGDVVGGSLMTVVMRNEFYRNNFRSLTRIVIVEAAIIVMLMITFISYINIVRSQDHYFATTADGRIMNLIPPEYANMSPSALLSWSAQTASEVMTFGFHDCQRRLEYSSRHFTKHGWETFSSALIKSRIIESITALQQVVSAEPRSAPILVEQGVFKGKYRWVVKLPLKVTYQSGAESRIDNPDVTMVIDRVSQLENPSGVGIEQWILTEPSDSAKGE